VCEQERERTAVDETHDCGWLAREKRMYQRHLANVSLQKLSKECEEHEVRHSCFPEILGCSKAVMRIAVRTKEADFEGSTINCLILNPRCWLWPFENKAA
jgi:hypothetical protein